MANLGMEGKIDAEIAEGGGFAERNQRRFRNRKA
jgi:hypothetical protein